MTRAAVIVDDFELLPQHSVKFGMRVDAVGIGHILDVAGRIIAVSGRKQCWNESESCRYWSTGYRPLSHIDSVDQAIGRIKIAAAKIHLGGGAPGTGGQRPGPARGRQAVSSWSFQ